ncbi:MAG: chorismate synthase [Rikenellaceae bacterium]
MNSFGQNFRVTLWGESHGEQVGVSIDGVIAGIPLTVEEFAADLDRRRSGGKGTTPRRESDIPTIVSGLFEGHTTGAPLTITFANESTRSKDYSQLTHHFRPSHSDRVAAVKYNGHNDYRGGGHFSGRLTLALTAAGVVAKKILNYCGSANFTTQIVELGGSSEPAEFDQIIDSAIERKDSVGGVIECRVDGVPTGLGEPFFDSVESRMAHIMFAIPAVKGVEFGAGFESARMRGSENNDPIVDAAGTTSTNHAGGINGGITNGNPIVVRVAVKPTPSISAEQMTFDTATGAMEKLVVGGRHDAAIIMRAGVVVEAAAAIALADLTLSAINPNFGS